jgi:glycerophosphoryl diester phosphodiesterase
MPRLKWHMLRRRADDPAFLRTNLDAALAAGAACEVDLVLTADGHFVCLHDLALDRETTGTGPAAALPRREIERLRQRGTGGDALGTPPLFLDEIVARVRAAGGVAPALVQLDIKVPGRDLTADVLDRLGRTLGDAAPAFVAGGTEWEAVQRLQAASPGLAGGFDPLRLYPRSFRLSADAYRALGAYTFAIAPDASIFYLEASMVLAALDVGVNMVEAVTSRGALVDAWTVDPSRPDLPRVLSRLVSAGCGQITTNDPETLGPLLQEIARA